jgi:hypothetical protein
MNTYDVRTATPSEITEIRFAEASRFDYIADVVRKNESSSKGVQIHDSQESRYLVVKDKEHADNLRKALDKAEELGWIK